MQGLFDQIRLDNQPKAAIFLPPVGLDKNGFAPNISPVGLSSRYGSLHRPTPHMLLSIRVAFSLDEPGCRAGRCLDIRNISPWMRDFFMVKALIRA